MFAIKFYFLIRTDQDGGLRTQLFPLLKQNRIGIKNNNGKMEGRGEGEGECTWEREVITQDILIYVCNKKQKQMRTS